MHANDRTTSRLPTGRRGQISDELEQERASVEAAVLQIFEDRLPKLTVMRIGLDAALDDQLLLFLRGSSAVGIGSEKARAHRRPVLLLEAQPPRPCVACAYDEPDVSDGIDRRGRTDVFVGHRSSLEPLPCTIDSSFLVEQSSDGDDDEWVLIRLFETVCRLCLSLRSRLGPDGFGPQQA